MGRPDGEGKSKSEGDVLALDDDAVDGEGEPVAT